MKFLLDKKFGWFVLKFLVIFCVLYFGTLLVIGLAAPGGSYSPLISKYFDYVSGIKNLLMYAVKGLLLLFGIDTYIEPGFVIRFAGGRGVFIAMDCVGYGVYSFWIAFVVANNIPLPHKLIWSIAGVVLLFCINAIRITLYLTAINKNWRMPLGIDHHTWFNIVAYMAIFVMIGRFERKQLRVKN